jgi:subtilisin family serine protease
VLGHKLDDVENRLAAVEKVNARQAEARSPRHAPLGAAFSVHRQSGVSYVETDGVRTPLSLSGTLPTSQLVPSLDNGLYGLVTTHTVEAQAAGNTGRGVTACVADTGLDTRHPDIAPNLVDTYDVFSGKSGLHATDVYDLGVQRTETHATHVSGIVLGADNGLGIVGVAPGAKLKHARVLETHADGSVSGETSEVMAVCCGWRSTAARSST